MTSLPRSAVAQRLTHLSYINAARVGLLVAEEGGTMRNLLVSTAASLALLGSSEADAATAVWSTVASDCSIDSAYTSNALVNSNEGSVSFASGTTGYVAMSCRVPPM